MSDNLDKRRFIDDTHETAEWLRGQNSAPQTFDPGDPSDAMAEFFRIQVTQLAIDADKITIYRDLNPQRQLECFIAGALTGLVGVAFASIKTEGNDAMMEYITSVLPFARLQAENIRDPDGAVLANHHDATRPDRKQP